MSTRPWCGDSPPRLPWGKPLVCELDAGHRGWHQQGSARWGVPGSDWPDRKDAELAHALGLNEPEPWEQMIGRVAALSSMAYRR